MMTQSIPIFASSMKNEAIGSAAFHEKRSAGNVFELFLAGSIKGESRISSNMTKKVTINADNINYSDKEQPIDNKKSIMAMTQKSIVMQTKGRENSCEAAEDLSEDQAQSIDLINPELVEQILVMYSHIKDTIMNELEITPEELDTMMMDLGLELSDLTDPQAIMQLVLSNKGTTDPFAALMDEQLEDSFQSLLRSVNDIKGEAGLKLTDEEIRLILEQIEPYDSNEALLRADDGKILEPVISAKADDDEAVENKDKIIKFQIVSKDSESNQQRPVINANGNSDSKDTDDGKANSEDSYGLETFIDQLNTSFDRTVEFTNDNTRIYDIREIAQQIIDQIRIIISPEQTSLELQLNPEHLGKVNLSVSAKDGIMTAHFAVQNELTKEAIEGQMLTLKETFAEQGIKVETIEVTVASYTFDQKGSSDDAEQKTSNKQRSGHKITFEEAVNMSEEPIEEADKIIASNMGYTVDYTA